MFRKSIALVLCICFTLLFVGCETFSGYEKTQYETLKLDLERAGLPLLKEKSPVLAAVLNIGPGLGNAYLEQWGPFVGNLLFWPLSVVWGVPQGYIDGVTVNKKRTLQYYNYGPGKKELEKALKKVE